MTTELTRELLKDDLLEGIAMLLLGISLFNARESLLLKIISLIISVGNLGKTAVIEAFPA
jgi:hypothetical protein